MKISNELLNVNPHNLPSAEAEWQSTLHNSAAIWIFAEI